MEHLDLFTPVEQGLPEKVGRYLVIMIQDSKNYLEIINFRSDGAFSPGPWLITHWLDLSKLTTKEKAEKAICTAYKMPNKPFDDYTIPELDNLYDSL